MNNAYHFFKEFRCGQKKGQTSKNPTAKVVAETDDEAWELFRKHDKFKAATHYAIRELGIAGAEELDFGGQKNPGEWSVNDRCWTKVNPFNEEDTFHEGVIRKILPASVSTSATSGPNPGPTYVIWLIGDYASWRYRRACDILLQPPKGKRRRRSNRPGKKTGVKPVKTIRRKKGS